MHTYCDDRGRSLMSAFDHLAELPGQFNMSTMYAGAVKAWHRHAHQIDHWCVVSGALKVGLYNSEKETLVAEMRLATPVPGGDVVRAIEIAPNSGRAVFLGEHQHGVIAIPAGLWHGGVAVGGRDALLVYYVTQRYDPQRPDEERRPWDAFAFPWHTEHR